MGFLVGTFAICSWGSLCSPSGSGCSFGSVGCSRELVLRGLGGSCVWWFPSGSAGLIKSGVGPGEVRGRVGAVHRFLFAAMTGLCVGIPGNRVVGGVVCGGVCFFMLFVYGWS